VMRGEGGRLDPKGRKAIVTRMRCWMSMGLLVICVTSYCRLIEAKFFLSVICLQRIDRRRRWLKQPPSTAVVPCLNSSELYKDLSKLPWEEEDIIQDVSMYTKQVGSVLQFR
jgi:hypothetical protein